MIANIGLMIAAYLVFRGLQTVLEMGKGGPYAELELPSQLALGLLAAGLVGIGILSAVDILEASSKVSEYLPRLP